MTTMPSVLEIVRRIESEIYHIRNSAMCGGADRVYAGTQIGKLEIARDIIKSVMNDE